MAIALFCETEETSNKSLSLRKTSGSFTDIIATREANFSGADTKLLHLALGRGSSS
jgi:hypothetical protein